MKKYILSIFTLLLSFQTFALDINYMTSTFKGPTENYVEFYMQVVGKSLHFVSIDSSKIKGAVEVTLLFKQGDKIVNFDKYTLNSPIFNPQELTTLNFIDVKRYSLKNGDYTLDIKIKDVNKKENIFTKTEELSVNYQKDKLQISDIQLIEYYYESEKIDNPSVKNGFHLEYHTASLYEVFQKKITFYTEIYNSDKQFQDDFVVKYYIDEVGENNAEPFLMRYKRMSPKDVNAMILTLNIVDLPTGKYNLHIEVRTQENELVTEKKVPINRANPYLGVTMENYAETAVLGSFVQNMKPEQTTYCLKAIAMHVHQGYTRTLSELVRGEDEMMKKRFLYTYWLTKDHNTPSDSFYEYMKIVDDANRRFASTLGNGFESDRGNVFLKYGEPNEILSESGDPSAPPYQVWRYNFLGIQQDVKFVFYDPDLAGNNYILLHSTMRGEINNPQWKRELYKNSPQKSGNFIDNTEPIDQLGRTIDSNFSNDN